MREEPQTTDHGPQTLMDHSGNAAFSGPPRRRRFHAPREDQSLLALPPLAEAPALAEQNHVALTNASIDIQGRKLPRLRRWSREALLNTAAQYTSELVGEDVAVGAGELLFVSGHQPELYHPGVWVKNFAVGGLGRHQNGIGLNLVVDNDTLSRTRIRVPRGTAEQPTVEWIPFDIPRPQQPWEEAAILDAELFDSFGERVTAAMGRWNVVPLAKQLWPDAIAFRQHSTRLVDCLTAARHRLERQWGLDNLELPISRLCETDPFLWFASHLLAHLPRFREIHNQVLREYRQVNRIRSHTHPVRELSRRDDWLEAPFWSWRAGETKRGRVFAKQQGKELLLSNGSEIFARLPITPEREACCAVEALRELPSQGLHFRTRALTTTLFARMCLADLFVHGIGGAKYDEMTDRIIARFFQHEPPTYLTLSATVHLPLATPHAVSSDDITRLTTLLRDLTFNPDRHLSPEAEQQAAPLLAEKRRLLAEQQALDNGTSPRQPRRLQHRRNHERYRRLAELNHDLAAFTTGLREKIESDLQTLHSQLAANAVLQDREYSFGLYPEAKLRGFLNGLLERP